MAVAGPISSIAANAGTQIDLADNIKANITDNNAVAGQKAGGLKSASDSLNTALAAEYGAVISRAIAGSQHVDADIIADARLLIDSGQLDCPETIVSAGQNILKSGI